MPSGGGGGGFGGEGARELHCCIHAIVKDPRGMCSFAWWREGRTEKAARFQRRGFTFILLSFYCN